MHLEGLGDMHFPTASWEHSVLPFGTPGGHFRIHVRRGDHILDGDGDTVGHMEDPLEDILESPDHMLLEERSLYLFNTTKSWTYTGTPRNSGPCCHIWKQSGSPLTHSEANGGSWGGLPLEGTAHQ